MIDTQAIRNKILNLAMRGKLTEQKSEYGTAAELYDEIIKEKARLVKEKKIKKEKSLGYISDEDMPYDIPKSWKWVRLCDISYRIWAGKDKPDDFTKEKDDKRMIPVVANGVANEGILGYTSKATAFKNTITVAGRGTIGFTVYRKYDYCPIVRLIVIEQSRFVEPRYLQLFLQSMPESSVGSSIPQLTVPMIKPKLVPLPPLDEQERIVEKIEEIFEILDKIDALQEQYVSNQEALKSKLIDAAIQGKLTEQLPEDGTAEELREEAIKYKDVLREEGILKNRKNKDVKEITEEDCLFEIPSSWRWLRLGEIIEVFGRIGFRGYKKTDLVKKGEGAITMSPSNISRDGEVSFDSSTYISWAKYDESPEIMLEMGDIVLVKTGSSYGKCGIINDLPEKATINPQLAILKYIKCNRKYLYYVLRSTVAWNQYESFVVGAATPTFSQEKLTNMMIPMPPMAEQERIVNILDQIFESK